MKCVSCNILLWLFFGIVFLVTMIPSCSDVFKNVNGLEEFTEEEQQKEEEESLDLDESNQLLSGVLLDAAVAGVRYSTATQLGVTSNLGP